MDLSPDQKALLIFDVFKKNENYRLLLEMYDIIAVYVPANMTKYFQPLDLTINDVSKTFLKERFGNWYAREVTRQLDSGAGVYVVDVKLRLSVLKPIHARWIISLYDYFLNQLELIIKGFEKAWYHPINLELETEDPFEDIL